MKRSFQALFEKKRFICLFTLGNFLGKEASVWRTLRRQPKTSKSAVSQNRIYTKSFTQGLKETGKFFEITVSGCS